MIRGLLGCYFFLLAMFAAGCYGDGDKHEDAKAVHIEIAAVGCQVRNNCDRPIVLWPMGVPVVSEQIQCDAWPELGRGQLVFPGQTVPCDDGRLSGGR